MKPLNGKTYGSIPHLPGSRTGKTDKYVTDGQARIATIRGRDSHDVVIIQEKLDGACVGVAKLDDQLVALTRSGNLCNRSQYIHHHTFEAWMFKHYDRFRSLLEEGERIVGEWLALAHGTLYNRRQKGWEPFVAFDLMKGGQRLPFDQFTPRVHSFFNTPPVISNGPPHALEWVLSEYPESRYGGERVEGFVWRVERNQYAQKPGVDFLCKYVRPDYVAGLYLPEFSGRPPVWNYKDST